MTKMFPNRTSSLWQVSTTTDYDVLPRPIIPISRDYPSYFKITRHSHPWGQLVYLAQGVLEVETEAGVYVVPAQQGLWLPPNVVHQVYCYHGAIDRSLHIEPDLCGDLPDKVLTFNVDGLLKALIVEIYQWTRDYELTAQRSRVIQVLLDQLAVAKDSQLFIKTINDKRLLPIVQALTNDPSNGNTLEQWAQQVGASSRTLNRLFNQHVGSGFSKWKQKLRVIKSLELLEAGKPSGEIADLLGYESSSSFIKAFTRQMGCSPKRYLPKV